MTNKISQFLKISKITDIQEKIEIIDSEFTDNRNENNRRAALEIDQVDQLIVQNSIFKDNFSDEHGSAIFASNINLINVTDSQFLDNIVYGHTGIALYLDTIQEINFYNNYLAGNKLIEPYQFLGVLHILNSFDITIIKNTFEYNEFVDDEQVSCIMIQYCKNVYIFDNTFQHNINMQSISINRGQDSIIDQCKFFNNTGNSGTGVYYFQEKNITVTNSIFNNNTAFDQASAISYHAHDIENLYLLFKNNTMTDGTSLKNAGYIILDGIKSCDSCLLQDLYLENGYAEEIAGGILLTHSGEIILQNITFDNNWAVQFGGGLTIIHSHDIDFYQINFKNNEAEQGAGLYITEYCSLIQLNNINFTSNVATIKGGGFFIKNSYDINFNNVIVKDNICKQQDGGGIFQNITNLVTNNFEILNNQAQQIGGIDFEQIENSNIYNYTIFNNTSTYNYGGIVIQQSKNTNFDKLSITENYAGENVGGSFIFQSKNSNFTNFIINQNQADQNIGGLKIQSTQNCLFQNFQFKFNNASGFSGGLQILQCTELLFDTINFQQNTCYQQGTAFKISTSSNLNFKNMIVNDHYGKYGGGGQIEQVENLNIEQSEFTNNSGIRGGALYLQESINIIINNTNFQNNEVSQDGGSVYIELNSNDIFFNNCQFQQNFAKNYGAAIYAEEMDSLYLQNSNFTENNAILKGAGIYVINIQKLQLKGIKMETQESEIGSSVYSFNNQKLDIQNSQFIDNKSQIQGAAIYTQDNQNINIENTNFQNNYIEEIQEYLKQQQGGAIFINNSQIVNIQNSIFNNNTCYQQGGALYLLNIEQLFLNQTKFSKNMVFFDKTLPLHYKLEEYPITQGGAIFFIIQQNNSIKQNSLNIENSLFQDSQASSGSALFFQFNSNQVSPTLNFKNNQFINNIADLGTSLRILGSISQNQQQNIENQLESQISKDNVGLISNKNLQFGYFRNEKQPNIEDYSYQLCNKGSFLVEGGKQECDKCLQAGDCQGGYIQIYPIKEYWRDNMESLDFYHCYKYPDKCLGNDTCKEGHMGLLCEDCDFVNRYSKNLSGDCLKCGGSRNPSSSLRFQTQCLFQADSIDIQRQLSYQLELIGIAVSLIVLAIIFIIILVIYKLKKITRSELLQYINCSLICFFITVQPGYVKITSSFLMCREYSEIRYTKASNQILCDSDYYKNEVLPVMISLFILIVFIIPMIFVFKIYRGFKNNKSHKLSFIRSYGLLFIEAKNNMYFWEVFAIIIKSFIAIESILFSEELTLKGCFTVLILIIYYKLQQQKQPYIVNQINDLAIKSVEVLIFSVLMSTAQKAQQNYQNYADLINTVTSILIILAHCILAFFVYKALESDFKRYILIFYLYYQRYKETTKIIKLNIKINNQYIAQLRWSKVRLGLKKIAKLRKTDPTFSSRNYEKIFYSTVSESNLVKKRQSIRTKLHSQSRLLSMLKLKSDPFIQNSTKKIEVEFKGIRKENVSSKNIKDELYNSCEEQIQKNKKNINSNTNILTKSKLNQEFKNTSDYKKQNMYLVNLQDSISEMEISSRQLQPKNQSSNQSQSQSQKQIKSSVNLLKSEQQDKESISCINISLQDQDQFPFQSERTQFDISPMVRQTQRRRQPNECSIIPIIEQNNTFQERIQEYSMNSGQNSLNQTIRNLQNKFKTNISINENENE